MIKCHWDYVCLAMLWGLVLGSQMPNEPRHLMEIGLLLLQLMFGLNRIYNTETE